MEKYYDKWLESEQNWIDRIEAKYKKDMAKYLLLMFIGFPGVFGVLGWLGSQTIEAVLRNIVIGLGIDVVSGVMALLLMKGSLPAKRYMKRLKLEMEKEFSPGQREEFAFRMLGGEGPDKVKLFSFIMGDKMEATEGKVAVTKGYAILSHGSGDVEVVNLDKVKRMEQNVRRHKTVTRSGDWKIIHMRTAYPIAFYYKNTTNEDDYDKEFFFTDSALWDQVLNYIREVC